MKDIALKEINRLSPVFEKIIIKQKKDFFDFAKRYYSDSKYFFKQNKYVEAFEAAIIAWAYIDIGLKLDFFEVPEELREHFTI